MSVVNTWFRLVVGKLFAFIVGALVLVLMLHVVINALMRSFANQPIEGTLEYVGNWYLPTIILLGLVIAQQRKEHIEAPLVFDRMPRTMQREVQVIVNVTAILFVLFMAYYAYVEAYQSMTIRETAGVSGVPIWFMKFAAPIGFLLYGVQLLLDTVDFVRGKVSPDEEPSFLDSQLDEMAEELNEEIQDFTAPTDKDHKTEVPR
ncbi:TRAP transporter small permease [Janibacter limosus]|uniref:TRAP transporter small permease n=1 Tax=Janibacter limosus TaxID=53458 RepID=UPI000A6410C6|nr:TRAP transporter small permease [Janibacter limosus]